MSRTPARFTEADINRAMKVAVKHDGYRVRVTKAGDIVLERADKEKPEEPTPLDGEARCAF